MKLATKIFVVAAAAIITTAVIGRRKSTEAAEPVAPVEPVEADFPHNLLQAMYVRVADLDTAINLYEGLIDSDPENKAEYDADIANCRKLRLEAEEIISNLEEGLKDKATKTASARRERPVLKVVSA